MSHLTDGLDKVKGIGPKKRGRLEGLGLRTLRDALFFIRFAMKTGVSSCLWRRSITKKPLFFTGV